jgi:UDP-2,3-diacylglucosamine hydrolase
VSSAQPLRTSYGELPVIDLASPCIFVADLHLDLASEGGSAHFIDWIGARNELADLVILGDLFDVWVGPAQSELPEAARVLDAMRALHERGTRILVVPGNRDFLLDAWFERRTGARVEREGFVGRWKTREGREHRCLAIHGDLLCTRDHAYQRLRRVLRSRPLLWVAPRLPMAVGAGIARRLRRASVQAVQAKLPDEKSMQEPAVRAAAEGARADGVICGHAHSAKDVRLENGVRWIVLDAFGGERDAARLDAAGELFCSAHAG